MGLRLFFSRGCWASVGCNVGFAAEGLVFGIVQAPGKKRGHAQLEHLWDEAIRFQLRALSSEWFLLTQDLQSGMQEAFLILIEMLLRSR